MEDLWPSDIGDNRVPSPVAILREQAAHLGKKTRNLVQADVTVSQDATSNEMLYMFSITAPTVGSYRYRLFNLQHDITLYPLRIATEPIIAAEVMDKVEAAGLSGVGVDRATSKGRRCIHIASEEPLLFVLRAIFASSKTRSVVTALLSQADPLMPEDEIPF